jgi:hypothetical protein
MRYDKVLSGKPHTVSDVKLSRLFDICGELFYCFPAGHFEEVMCDEVMTRYNAKGDYTKLDTHYIEQRKSDILQEVGNSLNLRTYFYAESGGYMVYRPHPSAILRVDEVLESGHDYSVVMAGFRVRKADYADEINHPFHRHCDDEEILLYYLLHVLLDSGVHRSSATASYIKTHILEAIRMDKIDMVLGDDV